MGKDGKRRKKPKSRKKKLPTPTFVEPDEPVDDEPEEIDELPDVEETEEEESDDEPAPATPQVQPPTANPPATPVKPPVRQPITADGFRDDLLQLIDFHRSKGLTKPAIVATVDWLLNELMRGNL